MNAELPVLGIILAATQLGDAVACAIPIAYLRREFDRLQLSARTVRAMTPVKAAAGVGLLVGLWLPVLGVATAVARVAYFVAAIGVHTRAKDPPSRFTNASGMLALTLVVLFATYLPAL